GQILVDGVDVATLGLHTLRSRFAIIPQDAFLWTGTLRSQLDPFEMYSDAQIWAAIRKAYLTPTLERLPLGLATLVHEGGDNFSLGEKCQICLARALLRCSKLLLLDEATASMDYRTDALVQASLNESFRGTTILTIAHRLNTIAHYDKV